LNVIICLKFWGFLCFVTIVWKKKDYILITSSHFLISNSVKSYAAMMFKTLMSVFVRLSCYWSPINLASFSCMGFDCDIRHELSRWMETFFNSPSQKGVGESHVPSTHWLFAEPRSVKSFLHQNWTEPWCWWLSPNTKPLTGATGGVHGAERYRANRSCSLSVIYVFT